MPGSESPIVTPTFPGGIIPTRTPTPGPVFESPVATPGTASAAAAEGNRSTGYVAVVGTPDPAPVMLPESGVGVVVTSWVLAGLLLAYLGAFLVRRGNEAGKS